MDEKVYQEELLEHFKYPKNRKRVINPDFCAGDYNPSCGDRVSIEGTCNNNQISDLGFQGSGCVISQAAASMLTDLCIGKNIDEVLQFNKNTIIELIRISLGPTRLKCALLSLDVLQEGLAAYSLQKNKKP